MYKVMWRPAWQLNSTPVITCYHLFILCRDQNALLGPGGFDHKLSRPGTQLLENGTRLCPNVSTHITDFPMRN